jgi:hypothetical protein
LGQLDEGVATSSALKNSTGINIDELKPFITLPPSERILALRSM